MSIHNLFNTLTTASFDRVWFLNWKLLFELNSSFLVGLCSFILNISHFSSLIFVFHIYGQRWPVSVNVLQVKWKHKSGPNHNSNLLFIIFIIRYWQYLFITMIRFTMCWYLETNALNRNLFTVIPTTCENWLKYHLIVSDLYLVAES